MEVSVLLNNQRPWQELRQVAVAAVELGMQRVFMSDHLLPMGPPHAPGPIAECWTTLAALSAAVPGLRPGVLASTALYRHPAVLAKMAAQVHEVSGQELQLGLGAGWQENELTAFGMPFPTRSQRFAILDEAVQCVTALLSAAPQDFSGRHFFLREAQIAPAGSGVRIVIGGTSSSALRVAVRRASGWNTWATADDVQELQRRLHAACDGVGRARASVALSVLTQVATGSTATAAQLYADDMPPLPTICGDRHVLRDAFTRIADGGVHELVIADFADAPLSRRVAALEMVMNTLA